MVVSPVTYYTNETFFDQFQYLDFLCLHSVTLGVLGIKKTFLCNGANLAYK